MKNGSLRTQWFAKYGYVPIILIGMAGLAPEIRAGERKNGNTIVAEAPVVAEPASKGYIMYAQLAGALDAGAVAGRDQLRPRPAQQHTRRDRAGGNAVRCRRADDEGYLPKSSLATIRKPRPANISAYSSFPTGSLPNTGMVTSTTSATARSRRPERSRLRPRSSRRTSVARLRRQKSTASTSRGIKAVRFIMPRRTSWHGRTCT